MARRYRRFTKVFFISLNIITSAVFLLACLAPTVNPAKWWFISMLGLGFLFLVITEIAFIFFWLFFKPTYVLISLIPLLIGWKHMAVFFAVNTPQKFNYEKPADVIRVAHWNVARFIEWKRNNNRGSQTRLKMFDLIKEQKADVLCMQEFFTSTDTVYYNNLNALMKEGGFPYFYYAWSDDGHKQWFGNIIFSKFPIIDSGKFYFPNMKYPETLLHVDLKVNDDTIRVYTTHLQSVSFKKDDYETIDKIKDEKTIDLEKSRGTIGKLKRGLQYRWKQADLISEMLSNDPYPTILTGDFNDVPNSYTYFTIRSDQFQDAFLAKGLGIGRTFNEISPTLRIDYILASREFQIRQFNRIPKKLSDHYLLVADMKLVR